MRGLRVHISRPEHTKWTLGRALSMRTIVTMAALKAMCIAGLIWCWTALSAHNGKPAVRVIAFFTAKQDQAHITFVLEAERWFPEIVAKCDFVLDITSNSFNLNADFVFSSTFVVLLYSR